MSKANEEEDELPEAGHDVAPHVHVDETCEEAVPDKAAENPPNGEEDELLQAGDEVAPNGKLDKACEEAAPDEPTNIAPNTDPGVDEAKGSVGVLSGRRKLPVLKLLVCPNTDEGPDWLLLDSLKVFE